MTQEAINGELKKLIVEKERIISEQKELELKLAQIYVQGYDLEELISKGYATEKAYEELKVLKKQVAQSNIKKMENDIAMDKNTKRVMELKEIHDRIEAEAYAKFLEKKDKDKEGDILRIAIIVFVILIVAGFISIQL